MNRLACGECGRRLKPWEIGACGRCLRAEKRMLKVMEKHDKVSRKREKKGKK